VERPAAGVGEVDVLASNARFS
jgi:hypothetical protein